MNNIKDRLKYLMELNHTIKPVNFEKYKLLSTVLSSIQEQMIGSLHHRLRVSLYS